MVRPIEISDSLSKVQAVERLQQDAKIRPEMLHQVQKSAAEKQIEQRVTTPNPVQNADQVVIHVNEQEKEKRRTAEDEQPEKKDHESEDQGYDEHGESHEQNNDEHAPQSHIDIKA